MVCRECSVTHKGRQEPCSDITLRRNGTNRRNPAVASRGAGTPLSLYLTGLRSSSSMMVLSGPFKKEMRMPGL